MRATLALAAALVVVVAAAVAGAAVPSGNLLRDPGAELGGYGEWDTANGFAIESYGAEFRPSQAAGAAIGGGTKVFAGGSDANSSSATQVVDVTASAAEIDASSVTAQLSAYLGGVDDEGDYATVTADFLPASADTPLGTTTIGPVTAADRANRTALLQRTATVAVPTGTRRIRVTIAATRLVGVYTDGYADNLSLVLTGQQLTPTPSPSASPLPTATPTPAQRRKGSIKGIKSPGRRVKGKIAVASKTCKSGRTVTVNKGSKTLGKSRTDFKGSFNIKTKKHKKGKLTIKVRRKTTGGTICAPVTKKVSGRN